MVELQYYFFFTIAGDKGCLGRIRPLVLQQCNVSFLVLSGHYPVSILHKSIAGRYRPVRVAGGPITARCRFIKNASRVSSFEYI